jgi:peptidylprolyl isomerase
MGMQVGGKRKHAVPAHLGYGERTMGKIPPNSNLVLRLSCWRF